MKNHERRALRYHNHMQRNAEASRPNTRMTPIAQAVRAMFWHGLPQGWGQ
jgi:hypothetical protein